MLMVVNFHEQGPIDKGGYEIISHELSNIMVYQLISHPLTTAVIDIACQTYQAWAGFVAFQ